MLRPPFCGSLTVGRMGGAVSSQLNVIAVVPYPTGRVPGQRFRIEQWTSQLSALGIKVDFSPFLSAEALNVLYRRGHLVRKTLAVLAGWARRASALTSIRGFDVAYVYRELAPLAPAFVEGRLARGTPVLYDFDDAIYLPTASDANPWTRRFRSASRIGALCRHARRVTVGNEVLAGFARRWNCCVSVVPTTIDTASYVVPDRAPNEVPVVGWTGSHTTSGYLEALLPALRRLRASREFELRVVGAALSSCADSFVKCVAWSAATEVADLEPFDVGLMPLQDDDWSRGKCGLKALQYMALGIAPIVSPVGVNRTIVQDGVNGLHASSEAEWVQRIGLLLDRPDLRARLGRAARQTVEQRYSNRVWAPVMANLFRQAAAHPL